MSVPKEQCQVCGHFDGKHHPDCNVGDYKRGYRQGVEDAAKIAQLHGLMALDCGCHEVIAGNIRALLGGGK